jgi:hypothetical protein
MMVTVQDLIQKNDCDIALFREYIAKLKGKPGTRAYIGDLERRIASAERSNAIVRATR